MTRLDLIRHAAQENNAAGALISSLPDIRWAVGFTGSNAVLLVLEDSAYLFTDGRYRTQAAEQVLGAEVVIADQLFLGALTRLPTDVRIVRQADVLTLAEAQALDEWEGTWVDTTVLLARVVAQKTAEEIAQIVRAQEITDAVYAEIIDWVAVGMTEQQVAAEIICRHLSRGAQRMSFDPIVASGPNSALPHARPTDRVLQRGEPLLLDFGCVVEGYASDMTRTLFLGDPDDTFVEVYETVLRAQKSAIAGARAGLTTDVLDASARDVIEAAGYGPQFSHSLGHGIGLQTHEWPRLSQHTTDELPVGCAVTIEPGIYLPGQFGVRIEDLVVLTEGGCQVLTRSPKTLLLR